jgi:hypothetical protein
MGVIVRAPADPEHSYRVRFPGGEEVPLRRGEFEVLKHYLDPGRSRDVLAECDLRQYVIYRCVIGSRAYGLATDESDVDRRGVYLPPAELHWSLYGVPEQVEDQDADECYWELQKFLVLALKANPNILEVLHTPIVEHVTPLGQELLAMRAAFLSKLVYQTYNAYVMSQFKKLERDLRNQGRIKWKHAMHLDAEPGPHQVEARHAPGAFAPVGHRRATDCRGAGDGDRAQGPPGGHPRRLHAVGGGKRVAARPAQGIR